MKRSTWCKVAASGLLLFLVSISVNAWSQDAFKTVPGSGFGVQRTIVLPAAWKNVLGQLQPRIRMRMPVKLGGEGREMRLQKRLCLEEK